MSAPNLTIKVEPAEAASCVYGALAARTSNDLPNGQLSLVLTITNNGVSPVHLNQVTVSFVGSPGESPSSNAADLTIAATQTKQWYFGTANNIILPVPAPGAITLSLACDGFSDPATLNMPLAQYVSPATGGGYAFPARSDDLKQGEYWTGRSAAHGPAGGGTQLYAYDLLVRVFDPSTSSWPTLPPGADNTKNENYYIWGKPIYAMADGVVRQLKDGIAANTPPGFPTPTPNPVEGNHFYIQHGPDLALYAHFQAGTLNPALTSGPNSDGTGAPVAKGQLLGLAGNSGNSSEPHLHIQVNRTTIPWGGPPRPLPFNDIYVLDLSAVDPNVAAPNLDSPWNKVSGQDLPSVLSAIWPGPMLLGKRIFWGRFQALAWAWIIVIGALMFTPGGVECIACGPTLSKTLGVVSIVLGVVGLISRAFAGPAAARQRVALAPSQVKGDMHGATNELPG
jgi:Peptidase family M23